MVDKRGPRARSDGVAIRPRWVSMGMEERRGVSSTLLSREQAGGRVALVFCRFSQGGAIFRGPTEHPLLSLLFARGLVEGMGAGGGEVVKAEHAVARGRSILGACPASGPICRSLIGPGSLLSRRSVAVWLEFPRVQASPPWARGWRG